MVVTGQHNWRSDFWKEGIGRILGGRGLWVNENWRSRYNEELLLLFGDLEILSFVRICR